MWSQQQKQTTFSQWDKDMIVNGVRERVKKNQHNKFLCWLANFLSSYAMQISNFCQQYRHNQWKTMQSYFPIQIYSSPKNTPRVVFLLQSSRPLQTLHLLLHCILYENEFNRMESILVIIQLWKKTRQKIVLLHSLKKRRRENIIKKINGSGNSKCSQLSTQL
jgi:hypothetical protein